MDSISFATILMITLVYMIIVSLVDILIKKDILWKPLGLMLMIDIGMSQFFDQDLKMGLQIV